LKKMGTTFRDAQLKDINAIFSVRVSVRENRLDYSQLRALGITPASIATALQNDSKAWVSECNGTVVGFSMANSSDGRIFALFVLPQYEGRGIGGTLLEMALTWLRTCMVPRAWLTTEPHTRADGFYRHRGWKTTGVVEEGEIRFELDLKHKQN
jgi:GNAT superfamily N-acetyltransferase